MNGAEILADCGGGNCPGCPDGTRCSTASDCASGSCDASGQCAPPSCDDGVHNQDEADLDCGGSCALGCALGKACGTDSDCESRLCLERCEGGLARCCQEPDCADGVRDLRESDVDCGGPDATCSRCGAGRACAADRDCASGACEQGRCCGGTAVDCTRCAERLSATQNCSGAAQGGLADCTAFLECLAQNSALCTSRSAPGCSNDPGGVCNHNTYGGNDGLGLVQVSRVLAEAGCQP